MRRVTLADDPPGTVLIQLLPVDGQERWHAKTSGYGQIGCPGGARCELDGG